MDWLNGVSNHYYGDIADDGTDRGATLNSNAHRDEWSSLAKFTCVTAPPPAEPAQAPAPQSPPQQQAPHHRRRLPNRWRAQLFRLTPSSVD